ncbi:hypothetical protein pb186bvf_012746 [Paramecium bursaria]
MYFGIDDILCEDIPVECELKTQIFKGGFLDPASVAHLDANLEQGHRVKLPFWMAKSLAESTEDDDPLASIEVLEMFEQDRQSALQADPIIENLRNQTQYFFELGLKFCEILPEEYNNPRFKGSKELKDILILVYKKRAQAILNVARQKLQTYDQQTTRLTDMERDDFYQIYKINEEYRQLTRKFAISELKDWNKDVLLSPNPVIVDFFATWCGPCKRLYPILEKKVQEYKNLDLVKVDIDQNNAVAEQNNIQVVPTVHLYIKGKKVDEFQGIPNPARLEEFFKPIPKQ